MTSVLRADIFGDYDVSQPSLDDLIEKLAELEAKDMLKLCDALVDDPRLRDLLEVIDDYLYLETDEPPPLNLQPKRVLN